MPTVKEKHIKSSVRTYQGHHLHADIQVADHAVLYSRIFNLLDNKPGR